MREAGCALGRNKRITHALAATALDRGEKFTDFQIIQKIVAQLHRVGIAFFAKQDRHQFIKLGNERFVGIDIHQLDGKRVFAAQSLQSLKHVVAQMAIRSGVEGEVDHGNIAKGNFSSAQASRCKSRQRNLIQYSV
jgi:hypothetical protein